MLKPKRSGVLKKLRYFQKTHLKTLSKLYSFFRMIDIILKKSPWPF